MKTIIIYHRADFDGIFCREIAKRFLPDAILLGYDYGDSLPIDFALDDDTRIIMMDISVPELMGHPNLIWIDHHKSAIEKYNVGEAFSGSKTRVAYLLDGVAACRLAWQWFLHWDDEHGSLPDKQAFIDRTVSEPLAVRLAGEYDIWDKRDPRPEQFQHGLRSRELTDAVWNGLLGLNSEYYVDNLLAGGLVLEYAKTQENESIIKAYGFTIQFEGLTFLACNHARFNSHLFAAGIKPEHDALLGFNWTGTDWRVSLYHTPGKEQHDLSLIAVKYGGGGHRGACGFRTDKLPFLHNA